MDAGHIEVYLIANHLFKPRQFAILMPNVFNDWGKNPPGKIFSMEKQERPGLAALNTFS